jgi:polysaccharide pyruvyl transferase CsaB
MRLVVSGYYGYGNTGDEAILAGMLTAFRSVDPDLAITVLSGDPDDTRRSHGVDAISRMRPPAVWGALRASDGLVSGGGGLLQDRTSARPVAYYAGAMLLARLAGRPYVVHAQGIGPIHRAANRRLAAMALRGAVRVALRDQASIALARELGVRRPIELTADPALALSARATRAATGAGPVVVAIRSWGTTAAHLGPIREALRALAGERSIVALPMHEPVDREASESVVDGVPRATVAPPSRTLDERLALIASAGVVVGMRLHALILAVGAGVPAVALSYDPKVEAFAQRAHVPLAGSLDGGLESRRILTAILAELDADPGRRRAAVDAMRADVQASAARSLAALRGG